MDGVEAGVPHPEHEHALQIALATALRERDDTGRIRRYTRLSIPTTATGNRPQPKAAGATQDRLTLTDAA